MLQCSLSTHFDEKLIKVQWCIDWEFIVNVVKVHLIIDKNKNNLAPKNEKILE